jgi:transcriptional regulator of arginine metabolism
MNGPITSEARRQAVARVLSAQRIGTQEALQAALRREGVRATQATLSRDLTRLGARRVSSPDGAWYEVDGPAKDQRGAALRGLVLGLETNASLAVVRTAVGAASAVARAIDDARLAEVLGTIAGDDTIFVAPAGGVTPKRLAARLAAVLGVGG